MPLRSHWTLFAIAFMALLSGAIAFGQNVVSSNTAVLTEATGQVRFQVGTQAPRPLVKGRPLLADGILETGDDSTAVLSFPDGQVIALGPNSRFRVVGYHFDPEKLDNSSVSLNLIEGTARIVMGAIGQHNPALVRMQVGTSTMTGARAGGESAVARGTDAAVSIQGTVSLLEVLLGQVALTLPSGQSYQVPAGQSVYVQPDGTVVRGSIGQVEAQASQSAAGKLAVASLDLVESFAFPTRSRQTVIALAAPATTPSQTTTIPAPAQTQAAATPPGTIDASSAAPAAPAAPPAIDVGVAPVPPAPETPLVLDLPPLQTGATGTGTTGAAGGGAPCGASCN